MSVEKAIDKLKELERKSLADFYLVNPSTLASIIKELEQSPPKKEWEPPDGDCTVTAAGNVICRTLGDEERRMFGNAFDGVEHAETCAKMIRRNNWIYQAKLALEEKYGMNLEGEWIICQDRSFEWRVFCDYNPQNRETGFKAEEYAEEALEMVRPVLGGESYGNY